MRETTDTASGATTGGAAAGVQAGGGQGGAAAPVLLSVVSGAEGLSADGTTLLLTGPDGVRYRLSVDAALRAAVRRSGPAPAAAPLEQVQLRPRDIQVRIRAGETAEEVAESAGMTVEQVRRYEGPVLAERAHVAALAREAAVRTVRARPSLEELVRTRLAGRGVEAAALVWDAWRREESGWAVQVAFRAGGRDRAAQWSFQPAGASLEPLDDEARWLTAEVEADQGPGGRRLSAVRVYDVETDGGVREVPVVPAPPLVVEPPSADEVAARTLDLLDALRDRRGRRLPVLDLEEEDGAWDEEEDDDLVNALLDLPPAAHPPASRPDEAVDPEVLALPEPRLRSVPWQHSETGEGDAVDPSRELPVVRLGVVTTPQTGELARTDGAAGPGGPVGSDPADPEPTGEHEVVDEHAAEGRPSARSRNRRSSVPSWDEIVFGAPRPD